MKNNGGWTVPLSVGGGEGTVVIIMVVRSSFTVDYPVLQTNYSLSPGYFLRETIVRHLTTVLVMAGQPGPVVLRLRLGFLLHLKSTTHLSK